MYENIAGNLRYLRLAKKPPRSQREIALKLHVSKSTYARYEIGDRIPPVWFLHEVAVFYGIELNTLMYEDLRRSGITKNENIT